MALRSGVRVLSGNFRLKSRKLFYKRGVNPASGSLPAGTNVRVVHSPKGGKKVYG